MRKVSSFPFFFSQSRKDAKTQRIHEAIVSIVHSIVSSVVKSVSQQHLVKGCQNGTRLKFIHSNYFLLHSSTDTATATVAPTIGLLPMPRKPIISTCAGTDDDPANCASECIRPMVSVMP